MVETAFLTSTASNFSLLITTPQVHCCQFFSSTDRTGLFALLEPKRAAWMAAGVSGLLVSGADGPTRNILARLVSWGAARGCMAASRSVDCFYLALGRC